MARKFQGFTKLFQSWATCFAVAVLATFFAHSSLAAKNEQSRTGQQVYEFYCYQCHGYRGDANTTAARSVKPKPANFSIHTAETLTSDRMVHAVSNGISGTAMASFRKVLSSDEINSVVNYIQTRFMTGSKPAVNYHSQYNGWNEFSNLDSTPVLEAGGLVLPATKEPLSATVINGDNTLQSVCISCHELSDSVADDNLWSLFSVSYPPGNYEEEGDWPGDSVPAYELHEHSPRIADLTASEKAGESLFESMCSHCHAEDGSGRNWIGSFLVPAPSDIKTSPLLQFENRPRLISVISNGLPGTSMPAWKNVLSATQLSQLVDYLQRFDDNNAANQLSAHPNQNSSINQNSVYADSAFVGENSSPMFLRSNSPKPTGDP